MRDLSLVLMVAEWIAADGIALPVYAGDAVDPIAEVRSLRAESNAAIAAHDAVRLRKVFADDYLGIVGTTGDLDSGGEATAKSYGDIEFKDASFDRYRRTPDTLQLAESGKRVAESGHWVGIWRKPDGIMRKSGVYLARWVRMDGGWRLKSELFITLECQGSVACAGQD
jgi:ketosteroid isomerase-like protein